MTHPGTDDLAVPRAALQIDSDLFGDLN